MSKLLNQVRNEINKCGKSRYVISKETGISEATLSLFVNGERGMGHEMLEKLTEYLGLEIIVRPKKKRKGRRSHGKKKVKRARNAI